MEKAFSRITIFEQRATVGGLWNYTTCPQSAAGGLSVPHADPHVGQDEPIWVNFELSGQTKFNQTPFMSPVYDRLETNIPRGLMGFSDLNWPHNTQLFPKHEDVLDYIERYADDVRHLVQFETQVLDVRLNTAARWAVTTEPVSRSNSCKTEGHAFDAVVVANGHFNVPYIPSVPGIKAWNKTYPGAISHSKFYRKPEHYADRKVIVVGNSASGIDIGGQIAATCQLPLLQSQKFESFLLPGPSSTKVEKPEIVEYVLQDRSVRFADGSIESDIDAILYCTGYFYSFSFLNSLKPPVVTTGEYVENLFQHIFYRPRPTLAFATLNQKIIPFPIAEAQSAVVARVWSGRLTLPSEVEMGEWEEEMLRETGGGRNFHILKFPQDADYIDKLHDWCLTADGEVDACSELRKRRMSGSNLDDGRQPKLNGTSGAVGKEPPYWGEKEYWTRERFPAIKKAFQSFGAGRQSKRTLEDVGFSFEEWKREKIEEAKRLL